MPTENTFGSWLRQRRRMLDLTQQALADQVGCARITLRRIEADALKPSKELVLILLERLRVPELERPQWALFARGLAGFPTQPVGSYSDKPLTNLPASLTTFIGREKEQAAIFKLVGKYRLVTLTGAGGVGKTRLSLKVGEQVLGDYVHGVWLVELASLSDPTLLPQTVAAPFGVTTQSNTPLIELLINFLRNKTLLLIFDNCEHLLDACAQLVDTLLKNCPNLKILATSREPLGILGEAAYLVPSLGVPDLEQLLENFREYESVRLFEERAQLAQTNFSLTLENASSVAQICSRLDGIPLAIELAAARANMFSTEQIAARLNKSFNLLTGGSRTAMPRQQTIRASIDWSWNLLSDSEQTLLRRLSVFAGGWTLEAAESVCKGDNIVEVMTQLVAKSLVVASQESGREGRYHLLETIRQYAHERLVEINEVTAIRDHHLRFFLDLAEKSEPHITSDAKVTGGDQRALDLENFRAALDWAAKSGKANVILRITGSLLYLWSKHGLFSEWRHHVEDALTSPEGMERTSIRAKALNGIGFMYWVDMDPTDRRAQLEEALAIGEELGDKWNIATALLNLGIIANDQGSYIEAHARLEQSSAIWQNMGAEGRLEVGRTLRFLGDVALNQDDGERARSFYEEAAGILREIGGKSGLGYVLRRLGQLAWRAGDYDRAASLCKDSLLLNYEISDPRGMIACIAVFANIAVAQGKLERAARLMGAVETLLAFTSLRLVRLDQLEYERNLSVLRTQLDEKIFAKFWAKSKGMTMEEVIVFALEEIRL